MRWTKQTPAAPYWTLQTQEASAWWVNAGRADHDTAAVFHHCLPACSWASTQNTSTHNYRHVYIQKVRKASAYKPIFYFFFELSKMQIESNLYLDGTPETLLTEIIVKYIKKNVILGWKSFTVKGTWSPGLSNTTKCCTDAFYCGHLQLLLLCGSPVTHEHLLLVRDQVTDLAVDQCRISLPWL